MRVALPCAPSSRQHTWHAYNIGKGGYAPGRSNWDRGRGRPTAIGAGAVIEGVEVERPIISPGGASRMSGRGRSRAWSGGARFSLPRAMRLQVAEGDEVALC